MAEPDRVSPENSVQISPEPGPSSVVKARSYSPRNRIIKRFGRSMALAALALSSLFLTGHDSETFVKPIPVEASFIPNQSPEGVRITEAIADRFNPEIFLRNSKKGVLDTMYLTSGDLGNGRIGINDTTLFKEDDQLRAEIQMNGENLQAKYPGLTKISTLAKKYNELNDTIYFLVAIGEINRDQLDRPLEIIMVPASTADNPKTQRLMNVNLPHLLIGKNSITGFDLPKDKRNCIDLTMSDGKIYSVILQDGGIETGQVQISQVDYKTYVPIVLSGTK